MTYQDENEFRELFHILSLAGKLRSVLEIGSMHGETLIHWMNLMEPEGTIVSIDQMVGQHDPRYDEQKYGHEVKWHQWAWDRKLRFFCLDANSRDPRVIDWIKSTLPQLDFLFIDGGHDYDTCLSDWNQYSPLVKPGGIVAFHDLGNEWPDVRKVWSQARRGHRSLELVQSADRWGIGVLYV